MAGTITHVWDGTVLTITSDAGTSSMDLAGRPGDVGPRGPQGPAGTIISNNGTIDLDGYATEAYVDQKIAEIDADNPDIDLSNYYTKAETNSVIINKIAAIPPVDLSNYYTKPETDALIPSLDGYATEDELEQAVSGLATENYVKNQIAAAQLEGSGVDLSGLATQDQLTNYRLLDNNTFRDGVVATDGASTMNLSPTGIQCGTGAVDISATGEAHFTDIYSNDKLVATQEYVDNIVASAGGSANVKVDNKTILQNANGTIKTSIGGSALNIPAASTVLAWTGSRNFQDGAFFTYENNTAYSAFDLPVGTLVNMSFVIDGITISLSNVPVTNNHEEDNTKTVYFNDLTLANPSLPFDLLALQYLINNDVYVISIEEPVDSSISYTLTSVEIKTVNEISIYETVNGNCIPLGTGLIRDENGAIALDDEYIKEDVNLLDYYTANEIDEFGFQNAEQVQNAIKAIFTFDLSTGRLDITL